jgi:hypothetical protein
VIVAWIWSILFYLGLDPIKWAMAYAMNEDGFRTRTLNRRRPVPPPEARPPRAVPLPRPGRQPCQQQAYLFKSGYMDALPAAASGPLLLPAGASGGACKEDQGRHGRASRLVQTGSGRLYFVTSALAAMHCKHLVAGLLSSSSFSMLLTVIRAGVQE